MLKNIRIFLTFLVFNFGALGIGSVLMGSSPLENTWYQELNLAPWTPPGWVFGAAWTTIMILFALYMTVIFRKNPTKQNGLIYAIHLVLNIGWNPVFFQFHQLFSGLVILIALFVVILLTHHKNFKWSDKSILLITPYLIWLCIAFSLNFYAFLFN
jgi:tryptophan-rich sensory protein